MEKEHITKQLTEWMINFVEKPNPLLNNWPPCPYARQARINNKFEIKFSEANHLLITTVEQSLPLLEDKDVIIICFDHTQIPANVLEQLVAAHNKSLMQRNYVVLEDHPDAEELLNGVKMNFGYCGLLLLSKLNVLNDASDQLRSKGYYDHWPKENIDSVVTWRYNKV